MSASSDMRNRLKHCYKFYAFMLAFYAPIKMIVSNLHRVGSELGPADFVLNMFDATGAFVLRSIIYGLIVTFFFIWLVWVPVLGSVYVLAEWVHVEWAKRNYERVKDRLTVGCMVLWLVCALFKINESFSKAAFMHPIDRYWELTTIGALILIPSYVVLFVVGRREWSRLKRWWNEDESAQQPSGRPAHWRWRRDDKG